MTTRILRRRPPKQRTLNFTPNANGALAARIGDLEVEITDYGACVIVWGTESGEPCANSFPGDPDGELGDCPEESGRDWQNCPKSENCPYIFTKEVEQSFYTITKASGQTYATTEDEVRDMFKRNWDGISHAEAASWPQPAAAIFAAAKRRYDLSKLKARH
jgi:hypothetical protein